jgi:hypothetical protein
VQVCFGPMVPSVVITAMKGATVVAAVKLLLCLNLLCTFPIIVRGAFQVRAFAQAGEKPIQYTCLRARTCCPWCYAVGSARFVQIARKGVCMLAQIGVLTCPSCVLMDTEERSIVMACNPSASTDAHGMPRRGRVGRSWRALWAGRRICRTQ